MIRNIKRYFGLILSLAMVLGCLLGVDGTSISAKAADAGASVIYCTHVQDYGWQDWVADGNMSGTQGESKRLEGISINVNSVLSGGIRYTTHVQDYGWQEASYNGSIAGTQGESKRLEAIKIWLTGELAQQYDIVYRTHVQDYGWQDWVNNGIESGTTGEGKRLEGIEIKLVEKSGYDAGTPRVTYNTHIQNIGWTGDNVNNLNIDDGQYSGSAGQSLRLEGITLGVSGGSVGGGITYRTHVQDYGWQGLVADSAMSGTSGESKRLEAIQIALTGEMNNQYSVRYRVHVQNVGWLDWAYDGQSAGTAGQGLRLEAIQVQLISKTSASSAGAFIDYTGGSQTIGGIYDVNITTGKQNALETALDYLDFIAFSYNGLVAQLEYEGFSTEEAIYAVDNCGANWYEQAARSAQSYQELFSFSRSRLIEQLLFEGFTQDQAEYGATAVGY